MAINQALGNIGSTVTITDSPEVAPVNQLDSLKQLVADMNAGAVKTLIILGGNPVYDAPVDLAFVKAMDKVPFRAHLSPYYDETSMHVHWHIPETHYLESWSDARAHDGTVSIVQPLIAPLYNGRSAHEVAGALLGGLDASPYDVVRTYWQSKAGGINFDATWRKWLNDGVIAGSALPAKAAAGTPAIPATPPAAASGYELRILPDPNIYDGRYANNAWLQELPKPQTKICWENVALISPKTAVAIGYDDKRRADLVNEKQTLLADVKYRGRTIRTPIWVLPGHPDGTITMFMGYGRTHGGRVASPSPDTKGMYGPDLDAFHISGNTMGVDLTPFRFSDALNGGAGAEIALAGNTPYDVACTQEHQSLNASDVGADRGIIRAATFEEYRKNPEFAKEHHREEEQSPETMYPKYDYSKSHAWAMVIDTSVCTGCNGCVVACQSENNIPVVGKEQVVAEREMHWLPAGAVHAVRAGAVRAGLPRRRHVAQRRRSERHDLQPLRRHALLLEQLPLQSAPLQLLPLRRLRDARAQSAAQSRRHRPHARRHGEVHILRTTHQRRKDRRRKTGPPRPRRRSRHRLPAGVPDRRDRVRRYE